MTALKHILLLWTIVYFISCTKDSKPIDPQSNILAIIKDDTVTVDEFKSYLSQDGKPSSEIMSFQRLSARLTDLVRSKVIASYGYENKLDQTPEIILQVRTKRDEIFYQKFLKDYVHIPLITEEEMKDFYERLKTDVRVRQILIRYVKPQEITVIDKSKINRYRPEAKALADSLYEELIKKPELFTSFAEKFSDDENTRFINGDIGFVRFGETEPAFEEVVFSLKDGEISRPLETDKGFHILMTVEHRKVENLRSYEEAKPGLRDILISSVVRNKGHLIRARINAISDSLLNEKHFQPHETNINLFLRKYRSIKTPDEIVKVFSNEELTLPLAHYDKGQVQILEVALVMKDNNTLVKLNEGLVIYGLRAVASKRIISDLTQQMGYTLTPAEKRILDHTEQSMMNTMSLTKLNEELRVSDEEVKKFYDTHKEQYKSPGLIDVEEIWSDDVAAINKLADEMRGSVPFDTVFHRVARTKNFTARRTGLVPDNTKDIIIINGLKLQPGESSEPFQNFKGGYSMIKLLEKKEGQILPLDAVKNRVIKDCLDYKSKITFNEWIANLTARYNVQIFPERIKSAFDVKLK